MKSKPYLETLNRPAVTVLNGKLLADAPKIVAACVAAGLVRFNVAPPRSDRSNCNRDRWRAKKAGLPFMWDKNRQINSAITQKQRDELESAAQRNRHRAKGRPRKGA